MKVGTIKGRIYEVLTEPMVPQEIAAKTGLTLAQVKTCLANAVATFTHEPRVGRKQTKYWRRDGQ